MTLNSTKILTLLFFCLISAHSIKAILSGKNTSPNNQTADELLRKQLLHDITDCMKAIYENLKNTPKDFEDAEKEKEKYFKKKYTIANLKVLLENLQRRSNLSLKVFTDILLSLNKLAPDLSENEQEEPVKWVRNTKDSLDKQITSYANHLYMYHTKGTNKLEYEKTLELLRKEKAHFTELMQESFIQCLETAERPSLAKYNECKKAFRVQADATAYQHQTEKNPTPKESVIN